MFQRSLFWDPDLHPRDYIGRFRDKSVSVRRELFGRAVDSRQRWTKWDKKRKRTVYRQSRKKVHDDIIGWFMSQARKPGGGEQPTALLLAGGPGSGKSRAIEDGHVAEPPSAVHIDPDEIKAMLPEWEPLVEAGDKRAARLLHEESKDIANRLQYTAMRQGYHIVIDGVGNSGPGDFVAKVDSIHRKGYDVEIVIVNSTVPIALARVEKRGRETGRYVPDHLVRQLHRSVSRRLLEILATDVPLTIYQNDNEGMELIGQRSDYGGTFKVADDELYDALFAKSNAKLAASIRFNPLKHPRNPLTGQFRDVPDDIGITETYAPDPDAPEKGEFLMEPAPNFDGTMGQAATEWRQSHDELLKYALHSWKGWPSVMQIHMADEREGKPQPSSGSGKQMRAAAAALNWELEKRSRINDVTLYRGASEESDNWRPWTSSKRVAQGRIKDFPSGQLLEAPPGTMMGLVWSEYMGDDHEDEWIARPIDVAVAGVESTIPPREKMDDPNTPLQEKLKLLRQQFANAAQQEYDAWQQDEDGMDFELGTGGICDRIAEEIGSVIGESIEGVQILDGGEPGDDHAYIVVTDGNSAWAVDIPYSIYETGGGYNWTKIEGVTFQPDDVVIEPISVDWVKDTVSQWQDYDPDVDDPDQGYGLSLDQRSGVLVVRYRSKAHP